MQTDLVFILAAAMVAGGCSSSTTSDAGAHSSVSLDATPTFNGNFTIEGTVNLPSTPSDRAVQLTVLTTPGGSPTFIDIAGNASTSSVDYVIKGVVLGRYNVRMTVDQNGNGTLGDSGDFDGYYNGNGFGTFEAATLSPSGATPIPVPPPGPDAGGTGDTGINFTLAVVP